MARGDRVARAVLDCARLCSTLLDCARVLQLVVRERCCIAASLRLTTILNYTQQTVHGTY